MKKEFEIWKNINGFKDYQVSNIGRVRSRRIYKTQNKKLIIKVMKQQTDRYGYKLINLTNREKKVSRKFLVHRLVAISFLDFSDENCCKLQVNHINHNRKDNRILNLEFVSFEENLIKRREKREVNIPLIKKIINLHKKGLNLKRIREDICKIWK